MYLYVTATSISTRTQLSYDVVKFGSQLAHTPKHSLWQRLRKCAVTKNPFEWHEFVWVNFNDVRNVQGICCDVILRIPS